MILLPLLLLAAITFATPASLDAQALAEQTLGRGYWHVFIAYAIAWLLVFGWAFAIGRRLARVERKVEE